MFLEGSIKWPSWGRENWEVGNPFFSIEKNAASSEHWNFQILNSFKNFLESLTQTLDSTEIWVDIDF